MNTAWPDFPGVIQRVQTSAICGENTEQLRSCFFLCLHRRQSQSAGCWWSFTVWVTHYFVRNHWPIYFLCKKLVFFSSFSPTLQWKVCTCVRFFQGRVNFWWTGVIFYLYSTRFAFEFIGLSNLFKHTHVEYWLFQWISCWFWWFVICFDVDFKFHSHRFATDWRMMLEFQRRLHVIQITVQSNGSWVVSHINASRSNG